MTFERLILVLLIVCGSFAHASPIQLADELVDIWPDAHIVSTDAQSNIDAVLSLDEAQWQSTREFDRHLNNTNQQQQRHWLKFKVQAESAETWYVFSGYSFIQHFNLYQITDDAVINYKGGMAQVARKQALRIPQPSIAIPLLAGQSTELIIEYSSPSTVIALPYIAPKSDVLLYSARHLLPTIVFLAALASLVFYNLFIAVFTRQIAFFYYCAYQVGLMLYVVVFEGLDRMLLPNVINYSISLYSASLSITILLGGTAFFIRYLLHFEHKVWHWLINATLLCSCLLWPAMWFIGMGAFSLLTLVSLLLLVSLLILTLFLQFQQQRRGYVFLVLVWLLNLFGLFWFYAFIEGLAPYSWWSYHIFHFTSVFEAVVFAITLSFKMRKDQFRRWQLEQQFDNEVDKQVQAQTVELTKLNSNLSKLALHDSLTHVGNRGSLDQTLQTLVAAQTPFSLILFDIDDFKGVNDRHGHLVGDMCLKYLCHSISQHVRDESLFRYGGEEFVILLPNVELTQAVDIAERVRLAVVSQLIIFDQSELQLTISLGVAQQRAGEESFAKVINDADVALYKAKKAGKNRTMMNEPE